MLHQITQYNKPCLNKYLLIENQVCNKKRLCEKFLNLTIRTGKTGALLNSVQKFTEKQGWLLLTFFICLHNQLSSFNSIIVQMSEKRDSSNRQ